MSRYSRPRAGAKKRAGGGPEAGDPLQDPSWGLQVSLHTLLTCAPLGIIISPWSLFIAVGSHLQLQLLLHNFVSHQNPVIRDRSFAKLMIWLSRVEEEKAINRALNGSGIPVPTSNNSNLDSNRQKSPPPAPVSRCCTEARRYEVLTESSGYQSFLPSWEPTIGEFRFSLHTTSFSSLIDPPTHRKARSSRRQSILLSVPHKHHSHLPLFLQSCLKTFPFYGNL